MISQNSKSKNAWIFESSRESKNGDTIIHCAVQKGQSQVIDHEFRSTSNNFAK